MNMTFQLLAALILFLLGIRLSAFYSGVETGFYRVSFLRLSIDAHAGDGIAKRLMWYARHPSDFVATTLVGNNVANYLTTAAIGLVAVELAPTHAGSVEIVATLLLTPVVFLCGELIPKNLYYRAPMSLLRRDVRWFDISYRVFFLLTLPLVAITRFFERLARTRNRPLELVLGRSRLVQVLTQGHRAGLLTDVQSRVVNGLMHTAGQPVRDAMTPVSRVLGVADDVTREALLETARRYGLTHVPIRTVDDPAGWYGSVCVANVAISSQPWISLIESMPDVTEVTSKLETALLLRESGKRFARVMAQDAVVGIVNERGLVEQMFRPPQTGTASPSATR